MRPTRNRPTVAPRRGECRLEQLEARDTPAFTPAAPFPLPAADNLLAATADFNGDGTPDLAVANGSAVSILLGGPGGLFIFRQQLTDPAIATPVSLATGDFDGNGTIDLAVASAGNAGGGGGTAAFLGLGDGAFGPRAFIDPTPASALGAGEFTGDGVLDLVVANPTSGAFLFQVLTGTGTGAFVRGQVVVPSDAGGDRAVPADLDGDGLLDFVSFNPLGGAVAFIAQGNDAFTQVPVSLPTGVADVAVADFDGDGLPDVVAVEGNAVVVHRNLGTRTFDQVGFPALTGPGPLERVAVGQFDLNPLPDLVAIDAAGSALVALNAGGVFAPDPGNPYPVPPTGVDVVTGDFTQDGLTDFATVSRDQLGTPALGRVFVNTPPPATTQTTLTAAPTSTTPGRPITFTATVTAVVPGAAPTPTGTVAFNEGSVVLGTAPLGPGGMASITVSSLALGTHTVTAVYSGDTRNTGSVSSPVSVRVLDIPTYSVGSDNGAVVCVVDTTAHGVAVFGPEFTGVRPTAADFNADGVADHVVGSGRGDVPRVAVVNGATAGVVTIAPFEESFRGGVFTAAGDVDGDGVPDVAVSADTGGGARVQLYLTRPGGLVRVADFMAFADDPNFRGGTRIALGDVNRDGRADLVVSAGPGGAPRIAVFDGRALANGQAVRLQNDFFAFDPNFRGGAFVAVGDTTGDGFAEVIVGAEAGGAPRVVVFDGASVAAGTPTVLADFFAGPVTDRGGIRVAARDLNQDGLADLITGAGAGNGSRVRIYPGQTLRPGVTPVPSTEFDSFPGLSGGVYVG